jgi:hypothetical protein
LVTLLPAAGKSGWSNGKKVWTYFWSLHSTRTLQLRFAIDIELALTTEFQNFFLSLEI